MIPAFLNGCPHLRAVAALPASLCLLASLLSVGCGRTPATSSAVQAGAPSTALPGKAEFLAGMNAQMGEDNPIRAVDVTLEAVGSPAPGTGEQALGYRVTLEATEDLFVGAPVEAMFGRLGLKPARWEGAERLAREELRPAALKSINSDGPTPKTRPGDLTYLRRVVSRGQRYTAWGRAAVVHQVDRWALLSYQADRVEPALRPDAAPRRAFGAEHGPETVFAEDDGEAVRRWAAAWEAYAGRVEGALERQRGADAALVARYRQDPGAYLQAHRWSYESASWDEAHRRFTVHATEAPIHFPPAGKKVRFPYIHEMEWHMEDDGTMVLINAEAGWTFRLNAIQVMDDAGHLGMAVAWQPPTGVVSLSTTNAILEAAAAPAPSPLH